MRMRSALLAAMAISGAFAILTSGPDPASALELGPVSLPVPVTLPTVGPVVVEAPAVAPGLGVNATVSPETGVSVAVNTPSALGPIPLPPGASQSVQVAVGADPPRVAVTPATVPSLPAPLSAGAANRAPGVPVSPSAVNGPPSATNPSAVAAATPTIHRVTPSQPIAVDNTANVVNASLRRAARGGVWNLWREVSPARMLWIALLLIALVVHWAVGGFLRDALRRARSVSSA